MSQQPNGDPDWNELGLEELGPFRSIYEQLRERPDELIANARDQLGLAVAIARADTVPRLKKWFTEGAGFDAPAERTGALGTRSVGVEWSYTGRHDKDLAFNGLRASGRTVEVRGYTVVGVEEGKLQVRRYVDWVGLFGQLGLSVNWRIPLPADAPAPAPGGPEAG